VFVILVPGRLSFAAQFIFKRLGRALLVPIFKQSKKKSSAMGFELLLALRWWLQTLTSGLCEVPVVGYTRS